MSIGAISNNNVSFGHIKTTKQGNEYKKTHAATRTGLALGVAGAAAQGLIFKVLSKSPEFKKIMLDGMITVRQQMMKSGIAKATDRAMQQAK